jgi:predicted RNase H-like nuclease (RuvC/YqgF family)
LKSQFESKDLELEKKEKLLRSKEISTLATEEKLKLIEAQFNDLKSNNDTLAKENKDLLTQIGSMRKSVTEKETFYKQEVCCIFKIKINKLNNELIVKQGELDKLESGLINDKQQLELDLNNTSNQNKIFQNRVFNMINKD